MSTRDFGDADVRVVLRSAGWAEGFGVVARKPGGDAGDAGVKLGYTAGEPAAGSDTPDFGYLYRYRAAGANSSAAPTPAARRRARAARATNGLPPGWDVLTLRTAGGRAASAVNGVPLAAARLPDLWAAGRVGIELYRDPRRPAGVEVASFAVRPVPPPLAPPPPDPEPGAAPWEPRFDGRGLLGWMPGGGGGDDGGGAAWSVEPAPGGGGDPDKGGVLTAAFPGDPAAPGGPGGAARSTILETPAAPGGVEVRAVVRAAGAGRGVVLVREAQPAGRPNGVKIHLVPDARGGRGTTGLLYRYRGGDPVVLSPVPAAAAEKARAARAANGAPDGFDVVRVRAAGDRVTVWRNGVRVTDAAVPDMPADGRVGLELRQEPGQRRDSAKLEVLSFAVRPAGMLDEDDGESVPVADAADPPPLFNGRNLDGWAGDRAVWAIRRGVIAGELPPAADRPAGAGRSAALVSRGSYGDFTLSCTVRPWEDATGGLLLRAPDGAAGPRVTVGVGTPARAAGDYPLGRIDLKSADGSTPERSVTVPRDVLNAAFEAAPDPPTHRLDVTARGTRIEVRVNGVLTATLDDPAVPGAGPRRPVRRRRRGIPPRRLRWSHARTDTARTGTG